MMQLGERLAGFLRTPMQIELVGDIGVGKTTFVKGLARGLGVKDEVTSPSFTINKRYDADSGVVLSHYDFYRLNEAGLMKAELEESASDGGVITVVEWAESVRKILNGKRVKIDISYEEDGSRSITVDGLEGFLNDFIS